MLSAISRSSVRVTLSTFSAVSLFEPLRTDETKLQNGFGFPEDFRSSDERIIVDNVQQLSVMCLIV